MIYVFIVTYKGKYRVINYKKYKGDPTGVIWRSLWERKFMRWCDSNPNVLEWWSEEIAIPYYDPVQKKWRRYFPDFWMKVKFSVIFPSLAYLKTAFGKEELRRKYNEFNFDIPQPPEYYLSNKIGEDNQYPKKAKTVKDFLS